MPCWKNSTAEVRQGARQPGRPGGVWARLALVWSGLCLGAQLALAAGGIEVGEARLQPDQKVYRLDADFRIALPPEIEDLVSRGIAVHFRLSFELVRERRYWFNREVAEASQEFRLTYHPITRSYRVSTGLLHQNFDSLDAALRSIARIRGWAVADDVDVNPRKAYRASLRLELDRSLLPKPFQIQVFTTDAWTLDSGEHRWIHPPATDAEAQQ